MTKEKKRFITDFKNARNKLQAYYNVDNISFRQKLQHYLLIHIDY